MPAALHVRKHTSVLAAAEKRLLERLARGMPKAITSDHLTVLGLAAMIAAGAGFAAVRLSPWSAVAVIVALAVNWLGDSLDGTLARVRGRERPRYGFYVDHVVDLAGTACLLIGMGCSGRMTPIIAAALLSAYLLVAAESYLATHANGVFRISFGGLGPTELRVVLAVGAVFMARQTAPIAIATLPAMWLFDIGGIVALGGLVLVFVVSAVRNARALDRAEHVLQAADRLDRDSGRLERTAQLRREVV
jgi:archaetidylinositol phosphate synthase